MSANLDSAASIPLWAPPPAWAAKTRLAAFAEAVGMPIVTGEGIDTRIDAYGYEALHRWSIEEPVAFWAAVWDFVDVKGTRGERVVQPGPDFASTRFFPDATLNFAENIMREPSDDLAFIWIGERGARIDRTRVELHQRVGHLEAVLRAHGVTSGDRVAAWIPNLIDSYEWMLAATSIGAVWSSASPDFGVQGVIDRFGQIEPTVLICADGYTYGGKDFDCLERLAEIVAELASLALVVVIPFLAGADGAIDLDAVRAERPGAVINTDAALLSEVAAAAPTFAQLPFDHPVFVLYSSGTTGKPKSIVHRAGGVLLQHLKEHQLHNDIRPGDRVFYFTTTGWMMWNWLCTVPASGATVVAYDGNPAYPTVERLFEIADEVDMTLFGTSAKFIEAVMKSGRVPRESFGLDALRTIDSTGSPLTDDGFRFVYDAIAPAVHLASMSGGTDLCGCLVGGIPTNPVYVGEIQGPALGMAIDVVDDFGNSLPAGQQGELVCREPFPSMPLTFWGDDGDARYRSAYFERFDDMWHQGDFAERTPHGGMVIYGRSDATLNPGGVRIGTAEIYRQLDQIDEILEPIVVGQRWEGDVRVVLFVTMQPGHELTDELRDRIRRTIRQGATPRHVPAKIIEVSDIPRTRSGKIVEIAVRNVIEGRPVANTEALANPEALEAFVAIPELQE